MSDELAAEEFDKHPENDFRLGGYVFRAHLKESGAMLQELLDKKESILTLYLVEDLKKDTAIRGWKTEAQHFQDQYGSRGVAEMPNERDNEDFIYFDNSSYKDKLKTLTPPCILVGHVMIDGGGKVKWCNNCDKEERLNSEGVWV